MGKIVKFGFLSFFVIGLLALFFMLGFHPIKANAQNGSPDLVLFLSGNSVTPFEDLSGKNHSIFQIPGALGNNVQIVWDQELGRNVYSFADGGYLEIPDFAGFLNLSSTDEMTIELSVKIIDTDPGSLCGEQQLPIVNPIPDQKIFSKGLISENGNYSVGFTWGRDDMRKETCDPFGYFPGVSFGISGTHGFDSPMNTSELAGWRVYSFLIAKNKNDPNQMMVWCYTNRNDNPYPANYSLSDVDNNQNGFPLVIGNGYATNGTNEFQPNPFFGKIGYIRIYKGLLPVSQLNDNPLGPIPCFPGGDIPPEADDQAISTDQNIPVLINLTALDGNCDELTFDIVTQPIHGNLSGEGSVWTYSPDPDFTGSDSFTFTANDGTQDSNTATVSINVKIGPELILALSASSGAPFLDLSEIHHPVDRIEGDQGAQVFIDWDVELGRNVYSFANGGYLSIPDIQGLLKLTSEDEMTIEICVKITDIDPGYYCQVSPPLNFNPPNQMIFCKGPINGFPRNYSLGFSWGPDDMRKEYCDPIGYFPGVIFGIHGGHGFDSPMNTSELAGWRVYSFLIAKNKNDPNQMMVWCYTNRNDNPYPGNYSLSEVDNNQNDSPLVIGNGYLPTGTSETQPNPFFGKIDYIRIYKGLLPVEELNDNPLNLPDLPVPPNQPPVAVCQDITIQATENCQAQVSIDTGSYDPEGDLFTLTQNPPGPYPIGDTLVTLVIMDDLGRTSMCAATVTVTDQDTDGDGLGDTCDPDIDGDGIQNSVDINQRVFSDEFSDVSIDGTTVGIITNRGDQTLTISDSLEPNEGVIISASSEGGENPALVSECGESAVAELLPGDEIIVTCGSVFIKVMSGIVNITFFGENGELATTNLDSGNSMLFEPENFVFTASEINSDSVIVLIGDDELTIEPGEQKAWIQIDIKPESIPANINPKSKGKTTVAILSNPTFDAPTEVNRTLLTFGRTGNEQSLAFCSDESEDTNGDGYLDLICHFYSTSSGFKLNDDKGILKGFTVSGVPFEGRDEIRIVGKKKK